MAQFRQDFVISESFSAASQAADVVLCDAVPCDLELIDAWHQLTATSPDGSTIRDTLNGGGNDLGFIPTGLTGIQRMRTIDLANHIVAQGNPLVCRVPAGVGGKVWVRVAFS